MNIDNHDYEISLVIFDSQIEVQWTVAMTEFIAHPFIYLLLSTTCFDHVVFTTSINVNKMATKLEANIMKYAGEEWISSLREMWRCMTYGTFFSGLRMVKKMKQIS
jgi:hypothetical protein